MPNKGEWGKWKLQQGRAKLCEDEDVNKTVMLLHTPNQDITVIVVTVKATCAYMEAEKP